MGDRVRAGSVARPDVPTCSADETVGEVAGRIGEWPVAVVVEHGCVVGLVRAEALGLDPLTAVGSVMQHGPATFRPSITCEELASYMDDKGRPRALLTTLHGELIGLVTKDDLEACHDRAQATETGDDADG